MSIDVETDIYNAVCTQIVAVYGDIYISNEYVAVPPSFPCVSVLEVDSSDAAEAMDNSATSKLSALTYEVNSYSDLDAGGKAEAKAIAGTARDWFRAHNFTCTLFQDVQNAADPSIHRYLARYTAAAGAEIDGTNPIYRR